MNNNLKKTLLFHFAVNLHQNTFSYKKYYTEPKQKAIMFLEFSFF